MNSNVIANGDEAPVRNFTTINEPVVKKHDRPCSFSNAAKSMMSLQEVASFGSLNYDFNAETSEEGTHQTPCAYRKTRRSSTHLLDELLERTHIEPEEKTNEEKHCIMEKILFDFSDVSPKDLPGYHDSEKDDDDDFSGSDLSMFGTEDSVRLTKKRLSRHAEAPQ